MFRILIVDDEPSVADSLELALPWEELGIEMVYKAYSGVDALHILARYPVDIVLTDIRMPEMSGIELSTAIRARWKNTSVIFLTGYSDFEYARHAVEIQAADYILKPFRNDRVLEALRTVIAKKEREWQENHSYRKAVYALEENLSLLRSHLLENLLNGRSYGEETLARNLEMLRLPFGPDEPFGMMLVRLDKGFLHFGSGELALMEYSIGNIAEELFAPYFRLWYCKDEHEYLVFLLRPDRETVKESLGREPSEPAYRQLTEKLVAELQSSVRNYLKGGISVMAGPWGKFPDGVRGVYQQSLHYFRSKIGREQELVFTYQEEAAGPRTAPVTLGRLYEPPTLLQLFELGKWEEAKDKIGGILSEILSLEGKPEYLLEAFWGISSAFAHFAHKNGKPLAEWMGSEPGGPASGFPRSMAQLEAWCLGLLGKLSAEMDRETRDSRSDLVRLVHLYVETHLSEDISLQAISDHVNLNPSYLSRIYKLETGQSISDYIYGLRMEKAAHYLRSTGMKIYEITAKLGYQYAPYFIKVFKQHFGVTPQEYRDGDS